MTYKYLLACGGLFLLAAMPAWAVQNNYPNFTTETSGAGIASFPQAPGLYFFSTTNYNISNALYDNNGNKKPVAYKYNEFSQTLRLVINYPVRLPGDGRLYSIIALDSLTQHVSAAGFAQNSTGLTHPVITPLLASWHVFSPHFTVSPGIGIVTPWGSYSQTTLSAGTGYMSICPTISMRYSLPDGIDIGALNRVVINRKNQHTDYWSGSINDFEFQAGWNFGHWNFSLVGTYIKQFTDDHNDQGVVATDGNKIMNFAIGPSVSWGGLLMHKYPFFVNLYAEGNVVQRNSANGTNYLLNIGFPLYRG